MRDEAKIVKTFKQTEKIAVDLCERIKKGEHKKAVLVCLFGELGSGKTAFAQFFAKALGIKEKVVSPTFVILKKFSAKGGKTLIHIDAYRVEDPEEILRLGWKEMVENPKNIILVEWAERVKKILPEKYIQINFAHAGPQKRKISIAVFGGHGKT